ncbi:hypothetical protein [Faecalitalea cylindroides]|uniref:hypothetical protein n=1 Tax=Faecalitalea cylindroides TaxID=39483 RepID=UPI0019583D9E|nr:hypothetical protein [Faecalitalea cylindroides]MBM6652913.1 hypothetical protein [Faecalitalea cylindroides]
MLHEYYLRKEDYRKALSDLEGHDYRWFSADQRRIKPFEDSQVEGDVILYVNFTNKLISRRIGVSSVTLRSCYSKLKRDLLLVEDKGV